MPLPQYTIITHWHWDYTFGIPYVHGEIIASERTNQKLEEVNTWEWALDEMKNANLRERIFLFAMNVY